MLYHVTYTIEPHLEGLTKDAVMKLVEKDPNVGACTAVLIGSLLYPEDGTYSAMFLGRDGRTGEELAPAEIWKAWIMLAKHLTECEGLSPNKRELCEYVFEAVASVLRGHHECTNDACAVCVPKDER